MSKPTIKIINYEIEFDADITEQCLCVIIDPFPVSKDVIQQLADDIRACVQQVVK